MRMTAEIIQPKIRFQNSFNNITPELLLKGAWVSTALALILTIPALSIFIGLYYTTGNVIPGALIGFSLHFATLAFATKITKLLESFFE